MTSYFTHCRNEKEAKETYRRLAKLFHPDHGGDVNNMIELQKQYEAFKPLNFTENIWSGDGLGSHRFNRVYEESFESQKQELEIQELKQIINSLNLQLSSSKSTILLQDQMIDSISKKLRTIESQLLNILENKPKTFIQKLKYLFCKEDNAGVSTK